ncbi:hypothetical protein JYK21_22115 [Ralstonia pickettii]|nr:hypothetical protein [Ralstonia pickettii]
MLSREILQQKEVRKWQKRLRTQIRVRTRTLKLRWRTQKQVRFSGDQPPRASKIGKSSAETGTQTKKRIELSRRAPVFCG